MKTRDLLSEKRLRNLESMVSEISAEELDGKFKADEIFGLIDLSEIDSFANGHIPEAIQISIGDLKQTVAEHFSTIQQIVVYAEQASSSIGALAIRQLQEMGYSNVMLLKEGKEGWKRVGLPLEKEDAKTTQRDSEDG